jgi:nucleoside-diphosphate-sugar epimerase
MGPVTAGRLLITGATGAVGSAVVSAALDRGHAVCALARRTTAFDRVAWRDHPAVTRVVADLATAGGIAELRGALDGVTAVVHAAAALRGGDALHACDTVGPTEALIDLLAGMTAPPVLVLVSSVAVYGYAALPDGSTVDETLPLEPDPGLRDAYARAKRAQEILVIAAAQHRGLQCRALRIGTVYGPGQTRTARLGFAFGPLLLCVGGSARIPAIHVADCALALVRAAETRLTTSDVPILAGEGAFEAINVVSTCQPTQRQWRDALRPSGWPKLSLTIPWKPLHALATAVSLAEIAMPGAMRLIPTALRREILAARFKPLHFSRARLEDRLGETTDRAFAPAMAALIEGAVR